MNNTKRRFVLAGIISLSLVATACGSDEGASEATDAPTTVAAVETTVAPEAGETTTVAPDTTMASEMVGGEVFVTGSSTVEPISVRVAELADEMSGGALAVTVEGPGTGDGFQKFCAGEADVSDASRPIKDEEAALCAEAGVEYVEIEVAIDGLTVATSPNNTAVECLDVPALYALIGPEAEGFANWSDANALATEVGSAFTTLPDAPLVVTGPGPESGTYDTARADYTQSPNDNVIVEGIEASDTSLGWVGYAFYAAEQDRMKALGIDTGDGCVVPTEETIADGTYGFSRSLYIYVSTTALAENPAVGEYVDVYLSEAGLAMVGLPADRQEAAAAAWAGAKG